ncbi:hypothetical protein J8F10_29735 [Gemmata sp. G18]|uniref:Bacteriophage tail tape measure N-terminal domain-containing protein n=1 Tax=Gemmata palustris TaxID=2822762 RepID=A0ABS5C0C7_9BACT|nr:hypothetical protein [Gemmata palustris]MBP3959446.1 hypothetical protein [Gemmata palustris]
MAGSNTIGTGAVVLTANADQLLVGLKKAEAATESWAAKTRKIAGSAGAGVDKLLAGPGAKALGWAAVAFAALKVGDEIQHAVLRTEQFNKAMERSAELSQKLAKITDSRAADRAAMLDAQSATAASRLVELEKQLREVSAESGSAEAEKRRAQIELDKLKLGAARGGSLSERMTADAQVAREWSFGQLGRLREPLEAALKESDERLQKATERRDELLKQLLLHNDPDRNPAKVGEINKITEAMERQAATFGMAEHAAKRLELELDGFSEKQVREFVIAAEKLDAVTKGFDHVMTAVGSAANFVGGADFDKMKQVTDAIKKQGDTLGFTANQIQLYDLRMQGFAERQLKEIEKLQNSTELLVNTFGIASSIANGVKDTKLESGGPILSGAALGGSFEAHTAVANFRASNAIAGGSIGDNPVQIAREALKVAKEQNRKIQRLIDLMDRSPTIKVVT